MGDAELDDLLNALDTKSSGSSPPPKPVGLTLGKAVFSDGRPVPKHAVKVMLEVAPQQKPMTATTIPAGAPVSAAKVTPVTATTTTYSPSKPAAKLAPADDDDLDAILNNMVRYPHHNCGAINFDEDKEVAIGFCVQCRGGVTRKDAHLNVFGNRYHTQHFQALFQCGNCKVAIGNNAFYEKPAGTPMCQGCYTRAYVVNCGKCRHPITDRECVRVDDIKYHPHCFVCTTCNIPLSIYWDRGGQPVCEKHYNERYNPRCCECQQQIIGRIHTAMAQERHPACFKCSMCSTQIKTEEFFNNAGRPVCLKCDPRRR